MGNVEFKLKRENCYEVWGLRTWILVFFSPPCLQRTSLFPLLQASCLLFLDFWCNWFSIFFEEVADSPLSFGFFLIKLILQFSVSLQIVAIVVTLFGSLPCSLVRKGESYWFFGWIFYTTVLRGLQNFYNFRSKGAWIILQVCGLGLILVDELAFWK